MKKKYLYLPLMAALAQISHAQLAEIYNAGTGNWEVDSQNATPMKKTSDDSAVNLYPLDGDYADYKILIDNRTYDNVIFGGNGDRSIGGASNGYVIGEVQISGIENTAAAPSRNIAFKANSENQQYTPVSVFGDFTILITFE